MRGIVEYPNLESTSKDHWVWLPRVTILGILRFQSQDSNDQGKTGLKLPMVPQYSLCMFLSTLFLLSWAHFFSKGLSSHAQCVPCFLNGYWASILSCPPYSMSGPLILFMVHFPIFWWNNCPSLCWLAYGSNLLPLSALQTSGYSASNVIRLWWQMGLDLQRQQAEI